MGHAIDVVRNDVTRRYSTALRWVDRIERRYGQIATDYGIRMSRALASYNAERLRDPKCREGALEAIELKSGRASPGGPRTTDPVHPTLAAREGVRGTLPPMAT